MNDRQIGKGFSKIQKIFLRFTNVSLLLWQHFDTNVNHIDHLFLLLNNTFWKLQVARWIKYTNYTIVRILKRSKKNKKKTKLI